MTCHAGAPLQTGEATLALAIRHAAPPSSAPAMVSFLVGAPMDSPVTKAAVMQALEWTREQQVRGREEEDDKQHALRFLA